MKGGKRANSGRHKRKETTVRSFRIEREALEIAISHYGRQLNHKVNEFIIRLAKKK